ncbi:MAG TPA: DUF6364 family protein [Dissulfurispiraceae bacterium]|nr:DUF6364 family protein [Dissulfurispiraceae bacterium]
MQTKLTLRLDDNLIRKTKKIAKDRNLSLSEMVAEYFASLIMVSREESHASPVLREISGVMKGKSKEKDRLGAYHRHLEEKYR